MLEIGRGNMDNKDEEEYVVGEEEAVWLIKLVLPYLNEFLSKLRSLFSGDPATTMKVEEVNYFVETVFFFCFFFILILKP